MVARTLGKNNREHSSGTDFVHPVIMPGCRHGPGIFLRALSTLDFF